MNYRRGTYGDIKNVFNYERLFKTWYTYEALITLILDICKRYKLDPLSSVIRHYDVTGKDCPRYYVSNIDAWEQLKQDVMEQMQETQVKHIKIMINEVIKEVEAIHIEGTNFIKLRDLADEKIEVGYDASQNLPIVKVK